MGRPRRVPGAQGRVTKWNQVRSEWPSEQLMLFGPGADSGTFDYFTEAVNGKAKASRGDYTASEDDNVLVQGVENNKTAIGYFGFAYYVAHKDKMRAIPIVNAKGKPVSPSIEAVNDGSYEPLSRPLFIYVREASAKRPEVKQFIQFYLTEGAELAKEVGYVPLPPQAYKLALEHFNNGKMGTVFGGVPLGRGSSLTVQYGRSARRADATQSSLSLQGSARTPSSMPAALPTWSMIRPPVPTATS